MSLEDIIKENTIALKGLTEAFLRAEARMVGVEDTRTMERQEREAESMASFKKEPASNVESKYSTPESGEPSQQTPESSKPELDYAKDVKPITLRLSKEKGREITISVLSQFGVKGAQDLDQAQWADYIAHCEKVLAGGEV